MQQSDRALVIMTNGDVYYVAMDEAVELRSAIEGNIYKTMGVRDLKTNNKIVLVLKHISALVGEIHRG